MARNVVKVLTDKGNVTHVLIKGTNTATINALRRTIMSEIPTLAIEELSIYDNNGVLFDEFLGHRLGLVPLTMDPKTYRLGDKAKITLEANGPGTVYSGDIKVGDTAIEVTDKKIPITKLKANHKIRIEGEAIVGQGKDHVKFQPAIVGYRNLPLFTVSENIPSETMEKIVKSCPVNIIEMKGKKLSITEPGDCTLCGHCEETGGSQNISVDPDDTGFILMIEGTGALPNKETLNQACQILIQKTGSFADQIKEGL